MKSWCLVSIADDGGTAGDRGVVATVKRMKELPAKTAEDHIMLAQLYSWLRPEEALEHIDAAKALSDIGVIGRLVRALASANESLRTNDEESALAAAAVFEAIDVLYPRNRFVREHIVFVYGVVAQVHKRRGDAETAADYFARATSAAEGYLKEEGSYSTHHATVLRHFSGRNGPDRVTRFGRPDSRQSSQVSALRTDMSDKLASQYPTDF